MKPFTAFFATLLLLAPASVVPAQLPIAHAPVGAQFDQMTMIAFSRQLQRDKINQMIPSKKADTLLVHRVMPVLPKPDAKAGQRQIAGKIIVAFEITKDGRVRHPLAVAGPRELQPYALAAVRQWTFKPYISAQGVPTDVGTIYSMDLSTR